MPPAEGIWCHERGHSLFGRPQSLQYRQDDAFFWSYLWSVDLTTENADFLAKYEEFDVLGLRRSAGQGDQPEELTAE
jgi:hypothetical protein